MHLFTDYVHNFGETKTTNGSLLNLMVNNCCPPLNIRWKKFMFNQEWKSRGHKDHSCSECEDVQALYLTLYQFFYIFK